MKARLAAAGILTAAMLFRNSPVSAQPKRAGFVDAQLLGGQFLYKESASSFGGMADLSGGYMILLSDKWSLLPTYNGSYRGFKAVDDLVGGGTLFQQSMDHRVSVEAERRLAESWSLKPVVSYTKGFFRETADEKWGKGLYDYNRLGAGAVVDHRLSFREKPAALSFGYHFFWNAYPNYQSLPSKYGAELATVGVGMDNDPGRRVMDSFSHQLNVDASWRATDFLTTWASYNLNVRPFVDQKIINSEARYLAGKRTDMVNSLDVGAAWKPGTAWTLPFSRRRFKPGFNVAYRLEWLDSNQNHFDTDPAINTFVPGFYDYVENSLTPGAQAVFPSGLNLGLSYALELKKYLSRPSQDAAGRYTGGRLTQISHLLTFNAAYPVAAGFSFKVAGMWKLSRANTGYEKTYAYNYSSAQYFAGVGYSF